MVRTTTTTSFKIFTKMLRHSAIWRLTLQQTTPRRRWFATSAPPNDAASKSNTSQTTTSNNIADEKRFQFGSTPVNEPLKTNNQRKERPIFYRVFAFAFGCAAVAHIVFSFVVPSYETITGGIASNSWPTVDARVTSEVNAAQSEIAYEFVDSNGEKRVGNRFSYWFNNEVQPVHEHVLSQGRRDGDVYIITVRYDPANPNRSVVQPGVGNDLWFPIVLSASMLLGCARVFRYSFTRFPTKNRRLLW